MYRCAGDRLGRCLQSRRPAGDRHAHRGRRGGRDRRESALRWTFHASAGACGGRAVVAMAPSTTDLDGLVTEAAKILDKAAERFVKGRGADSAVRKKGNDFATEVDLAIEREGG